MKLVQYPAVPACLILAILAGCAGKPPEDDSGTESPEEALARIEQIRIRTPDPGPRLNPVPVRRSEAWLGNALAARYQGLRADLAIRLVAQHRPVRFNFPVTDAPLVRAAPQPQSIRRHLDTIASQADWAWDFADGVLQVHDIETRQFVLSAQPGSSQAHAGLRNLHSKGGGSADNTVSLELDPYTLEILQTVEGVLGAASEGGAADPRTRATIAPSANLLTVTARPQAMRRVEQVMRRYNQAASSIVRIALSIIEVELEDADRHELLISLLRAGSDLPLSLIIGTDGNSAAAGPVLTDALESAVLSRGSRYVGSSVVFDWLETFGNISITYDDTIEVINNHLASVDVTRTEQYVSKISREPVSDSGDAVSTEVEFEELRTGLALHLQPTVVDGRITLRLGMSRSTPVDRLQYAFEGVAGSNWVIEEFNRMLSVSLADGEQKLLSSFSQATSRQKRSRIPFLGPFGRGREQSLKRRETVMLITADVVRG